MFIVSLNKKTNMLVLQHAGSFARG